MDSYQRKLYEMFEPFLIERNEAPYPPDHEGDYLEEYFTKKFFNELNQSERYLIPVYWTAVFNYRISEGFGHGTPNYSLRQALFDKLKELDPTKKYFTVSTHDDAPMGSFPTDTKHLTQDKTTRQSKQTIQQVKHTRQ